MIYSEVVLMKQYHKTQIDALVAKNIESDKKILALEEKVNNLEQQLLANCIEIYNVPNNNNTLTNVDIALKVLCDGLNVNINKADIDQCYMKKITTKPSSNANATNKNVKSTNINILRVKLVSQLMKEKIMKTKRERRDQLTTNLFDAKRKSENIFVNDCLTYETRQLLNKALSLKTEMGFKYVWTKNGRVYMRRSEGDKPVRIFCAADFDKI
ncbi:uncharacterized protein LOC129947027 [Eupeodes corollae]|uniref:uncharacterized protein LOC129947027 n=1 Tax=Eupeodes corollae TaxID=290404 RepID=UPI002492B779|nr:uncharacterized protein LOC129947027 [Eupeodes corollae]